MAIQSAMQAFAVAEIVQHLRTMVSTWDQLGMKASSQKAQIRVRSMEKDVRKYATKAEAELAAILKDNMRDNAKTHIGRIARSM